MKHLIASLGLLAAAGTAAAAGGGGTIYDFEPDIGNKASVQRGAAAYMNYCSGCHSLRFMRYNRLAEDNGIPEDLLAQLMFTTDKPGNHILSAIPKDASAEWFGQTPPDLSLTARSRGEAWIYSFLKSFYLNESKATGVDNLQLPGASMPHVLAPLQGYQAKHVADHSHDGDGADHSHGGGHGDGHHGPQLDLAVEGSLTPEEYDDFVADIVNFLSYVGEPGKEAMHATGGWVLLYLLLLIPLTYAIKKEFWKDIH